MSHVTEAEWLLTLNDVSTWEPPIRSTLIVAPHPDDETLGAGGLIAYLRSHNAEVFVAAVTDGEKAYGFDPNLAPVRRREQVCALSCLGVPEANILSFRLPDSDVTSHEKDLVVHLTPLISRDTHVICTWKGDQHPDHEACGRAAESVALQIGATVTSYFFWTWHWGDLSSLQNLNLRRFQLSDELLRAKSEALLCHRSQLQNPEGKPILPDSLLAPARRPFEIFALA